MMTKLSNFKIYLILIAVAVILGFIASYKVALGFFGLFHLLMWINISIVDLCSAIITKEANNGSNLYKLICILISAICIPLFLI